MRGDLKFAFALGSDPIDPHQAFNPLVIAFKATLT
jgi:hypothetical protein